MSLIHLAAGHLRATIVPSLGAGLADFSIIGPSGFAYPLMRRAAPGGSNASFLASFFMAPWVNRVGGARFSFEGKTYTLKPTTPPGTPPDEVVAQHGDVRKRPWHVLEATSTSASLRIDSREHPDFNWPWPCCVHARYELSADGLQIDLSVENLSTERFPAGCGHHPYFMRRLWNDTDDLHVRVPVRARYPLTHGVGTGPAVEEAQTRALQALSPVPPDVIDSVFAASADGSSAAELFWPKSGVRLFIEPSTELGHWVVFTPHEHKGRSSPLSFVAIEPQSQANGALNLANMGVLTTGTHVLEPGQSLRTRVMFRVLCTS